jgi:hypothetical protein
MVAYSFKKRFVDPIKSGLGIYDPILGLQPKIVKPKRQTIRAIGKRRHARAGETLQLYTAMRTKQCEKIGEARCTAVYEITIAFAESRGGTIISLDGFACYMGSALEGFAHSDGFDDWKEMRAFWEKEHGIERPFKGVLITWEPLA